MTVPPNKDFYPPASGSNRKLRVAWFSYFPIEWLPDAPEELKRLIDLEMEGSVG